MEILLTICSFGELFSDRVTSNTYIKFDYLSNKQI